MHVSIYSCMDGWLHINKGVQACRPASKHVFVREHMQAHTACCRNGYIRLFYHDRSWWSKSFMYARMRGYVCVWTVAYTYAKVYKHAGQHAHTYACVNTRTYIKPDDEEVITARLALRSKRLYPLTSLWSIMMIKTLHVCMHVSTCSRVDGWLHMSKGVWVSRTACKHARLRECMQVCTVWDQNGYNRLFYSKGITAANRMTGYNRSLGTQCSGGYTSRI